MPPQLAENVSNSVKVSVVLFNPNNDPIIIACPIKSQKAVPVRKKLLLNFVLNAEMREKIPTKIRIAKITPSAINKPGKKFPSTVLL